MKFSRILPLFAVLTAVIAQLDTGYYYIRAQTNDRPYIGRSYREDKSLLPKRVGEVRNEEPELWVIEARPYNKFILRARNAPVGVIRNLLFAFLIDEERAEEWTITRVPEGGPDVYTIETSSPGVGWVKPADNDETQQIQILPLHGGPSGHPASELFQIIPQSDE